MIAAVNKQTSQKGEVYFNELTKVIVCELWLGDFNSFCVFLFFKG